MAERKPDSVETLRQVFLKVTHVGDLRCVPRTLMYKPQTAVFSFTEVVAALRACELFYIENLPISRLRKPFTCQATRKTGRTKGENGHDIRDQSGQQ